MTDALDANEAYKSQDFCSPRMAPNPRQVPILWILGAQREGIITFLHLPVQVHKMMTSYMEFMMATFLI